MKSIRLKRTLAQLSESQRFVSAFAAVSGRQSDQFVVDQWSLLMNKWLRFLNFALDRFSQISTIAFFI